MWSKIDISLKFEASRIEKKYTLCKIGISFKEHENIDHYYLNKKINLNILYKLIPIDFWKIFNSKYFYKDQNIKYTIFFIL